MNPSKAILKLPALLQTAPPRAQSRIGVAKLIPVMRVCSLKITSNTLLTLLLRPADTQQFKKTFRSQANDYDGSENPHSIQRDIAHSGHSSGTVLNYTHEESCNGHT